VTCRPQHITYQTEKRLKSPQPMLPSTPAKTPAPARVAAEEPHIHQVAGVAIEDLRLGIDVGRGDYSAIVVVDSSGRVQAL